MDQKLFHGIYSYGQKNKWLYRLCDWITKGSVILFPLVYVGFGLVLLLNQRAVLLSYLLLPASVLFINTVLRKCIKRKRPYQAFPFQSSLPKKSQYSFPSNHAASSMIIAFVLFIYFQPMGIFLFLCAFVTGMSRIVLGYHYPSDVFCGWLLGLFFGVLLYIVVI